MNRYLLLVLNLFFLFNVSSAQKTAKRELRGVWISTHASLDWPNPTQSQATQKANLISILTSHKAAGVNVIYFQVRNQCDALYPSAIEPWSSVLTGTQGRDPGWDPLQFAIEETHKRGMELHAWINPYRAVATASQLSTFTSTHVAKQHPEWLLNNGSTITLDPGIPAVRDYITSVVTDITTRYDIDGIHFDDYFYPPAPFNDDATYTAYPRGFPATTAGRADWRRDNINIFIQSLYATLSSLKPWVKFGVSPSGIYRNGTSVGGSATSGAEHYSAVYADTKKWLQQKWVDYIAPQVYWHIGFSVADYSKLIPWWNDNAFGRHIYIGMASYKVNMTFPTTGTGPVEDAAWKIRSQYPNELRLNRQPEYGNVLGEMHFRSAFLIANALGHRDSMRLNVYKRPALPPVMPWRDNTPPAAPTGLTAVKQPNNNYILVWSKPSAATVESDKARQFVIYRSETPVINLEDTANLLFITPTDITTYTDPNTANRTFYYAVTSVDRGYVESAPSNVTDYQPPVIICPSAQMIQLDSACAVALPDYRAGVIVSDDVTPAGSIVVTQSPAAGTVLSGSGIIQVTVTATDLSGKSSSCSFTVAKEDVISPQITYSAPLAVSTDPGACSATVTVSPPAVSDNCETPEVTGVRSDGQPLSASFPKGVTTIMWTAKDNANNQTSVTQTVTVTDDEKPTITAPPTVMVSADEGDCNAAGVGVNLGTPLTGDNCGVASVANDAPFIFPKGNTTVTWTVTDLSGNVTTATQVVTVVDNEAPVPVVAELPTIAGECSAGVLTVPTAIDNCAGVVIGTTSDPTSFTTQGTYTITWSYNDGNGNTTTQSQTVIIKDVTPPVKPVLGDVTGECAASAAVPTTIDNCAGVVTGTTSDPLYYTTQGTHLIIWSFEDGNGNVTTATQKVIVKDVTKPLTPVLADVNGECSATASVSITTDNCAGIVTGTTNDPLNYSTQGMHVIHWRFDDGNGNITTATQNVLVKDVTAPTITAPANLSVGSCNPIVLGSPITADNCHVASVTNNAPASYPVGITTVTWTVTDDAGNKATAMQTVTMAPSPEPAISVSRSNTTFTGLPATTITLGYGAQSLSLTATGGTTYSWSNGAAGASIPIRPEMTTTYTVTAKDGYGCANSASITVTVVDVRCGNNDDKILVCQKTGSAKNPWIQTCIAPSAVATHLAIGSALGICSLGSVTMGEDAVKPSIKLVPTLSVYPNPSRGLAICRLVDFAPGKVNVVVADARGRVVVRFQESISYKKEDLSLHLNHLAAGLYIIKVTGLTESVITKMVIAK